MSYAIVFLLLLTSPFKAFKIFSNLILGSDFLNDIFTFKKEHIERLNVSNRKLIKKFYPKLFAFFREKKVDIWEIFMIEVLFK